MPELPDIVVYTEALERHAVGRTLVDVRLGSPFLLRSVTPPLSDAVGRAVTGCRRLGKRLVIELEDELFLVLHLMIAGRLRLRPPRTKLARKVGLAAFDFADHTIVLTEAGTRKRASLHVVFGEEDLAAHDPGGLEVLDADVKAFAAALGGRRHTIKRALTDPRILGGIGNAYSDEILHRARMSPFKRTDQFDEDELARLFAATRDTLTEWTERLRRSVGEGFPDKVTAFHAGMAVHGKYGEPCPECETAVQRIVYAENESNYCPRCQTGGRLLADRARSRLLRDDWPKTMEELEGRSP